MRGLQRNWSRRAPMDVVTPVTGIGDHAAELAVLWPALAAALERDTAADGTVPGGALGSAAVVNTDVLAAMILLSRDVPAVTRAACEAAGEPWQPRPVQTCLRALPRLAERLGHLGMAGAAQTLEGAVWDWLRVTKRALGLRRPDIPVGFACPWAASAPEDHAEGRMLLCAGDEGFLRPGPGGMAVEWVTSGQIYCPARACGASWPQGQWRLLGRMLGAAAVA